MSRPALLAVDWGTSSLRGALLAEDGAVIDECAAPRGLLSVPAGGWPAVFDEVFGGWLSRHPGLPTLMCGMVGSRQGWIEAPYCATPASLADIAGRLAWVRPGAVAIVPGLVCNGDGIPDVMRGEETQVFGALALCGLDSATLVLPGTHSKWVRAEKGRITAFATQMTGECYALFRQQSILARMLPADEPPLDVEGFDAGVDRALLAGGLLHHLFGVRTQALLGRPGAEPGQDQDQGSYLASYLSGLVIGEELRAQAPPADEPVLLVGGAGLAARYQRALARLSVPARAVGAEASWHGLSALAGTLWR